MKKYRNMIIQFIKFSIVGISNTLISIAAYYLFLFMGIHYIAANTIGYLLGTLNAYYWNNKYVFKKGRGEERSSLSSLIKSFLSYGITYLLSTGLLYVWVDIMGIPETIAPIINLCITTPLNFFLNKLWAFKNNNQPGK